jgi:phospholipid/cholesterol/gamma-HCH transport system substrate-binding protein
MRNFLIGIFLLSAFGLFFGLVMFLRPSVGDKKQTLYVRFSNVNKIGVGTRVLFAGKPIGQVTSIQEISHARQTQPTDPLGRLYFYQLTLKLDSNIHVYNTDEISVQTSGLLGEKSIAITPRTPPRSITPELITDQSPIYADSIDPLENTFNQLSDIGEKLNTTAGYVQVWLEQNGATITHAIQSFGSAMAQIDHATAAINQENLIGKMHEGVTAMTSSMAKIDDALKHLTDSGVFENFGPLVENMKNITTSFEKIGQEIADGQGTIGRLVHGDELYLRFNAVMSKADTLMNDVNHWGVLFHLNKEWQRTRTQRMTAMNSLEDPLALKRYFQTEVDQINTAMARLSLLIDKAKQEDNLVHEAKFQENFAELMRQVTELSDNLHLYNEKLQTHE